MKLHDYGACIYCYSSHRYYSTLESFMEFLESSRGKPHAISFFYNGVVQQLAFEKNGELDVFITSKKNMALCFILPLRQWIRPTTRFRWWQCRTGALVEMPLAE